MNFKTKDIVEISMMTAMIAAFGLIPSIPLSFIPVPITLQTFPVYLAGALLGPRNGAISMIIFNLLVAAGAPVLSGGRGGLAVFQGPSGGFVIAWIFVALFIGWMTRYLGKVNLATLTLTMVVGGIGVMYAIGVPVMAHYLDKTLVEGFKLSLTFIPGDLIKIAVAVVLAQALLRTPVFKQKSMKNVA